MLITSGLATDGWYSAMMGDKIGLVPASYIQYHALQPAIMRADFAAEHESELRAGQGERIGIVSHGRSLDGWVLAVATNPDKKGGLGPGLVPTEWVEKASPCQVVSAFKAEDANELSVELGELLWSIREVPRHLLALDPDEPPHTN